MNQIRPPRVFISYSHDDRDHRRWVLGLGEELRRNGVDPIIDAWDLRPGADVLKFMEHSLINSDRVLLICTEKYVDKMNDGVGGGRLRSDDRHVRTHAGRKNSEVHSNHSTKHSSSTNPSAVR